MAVATEDYDIVIVGAGHGGAQTAIALRQRGFAGSIALIGDEPDPPYERPPLSKDYLTGDKPFERMLIRPAAFWSDRGVAVIAGATVAALDADAKRVATADGRGLRYGTLVWAAGGAARRLTCDGHDLGGVHTVRTRADVDRLRAELPGVTRAIVVGGGYIGLEAAAALTKLGKPVTVLEAAPRVLARVAGEALSAFYAAAHRAHGVDLCTGVTVERIEGGGGTARGVRLADGAFVSGELVVVGIGIVPAVAPLVAAGAAVAETAGGVLVDALCRTSLPDVYAVGDAAAQANRYADHAVVRVESVQNATDQAATVARALTGAPEPYDAVPWFWSNQYDLRLQTVGLSRGHDVTVVRGDPAERAFSVIYLKDGRVIALDCVNATRDYVQGRALVVARARVEPHRLADPAVALKALAPDP